MGVCGHRESGSGKESRFRCPPFPHRGRGWERGSGCPAPAGGGRQGGATFSLGCARKTGIEKALFVRTGIKRVRYSQKSIGVDYVLPGDLPGQGEDRPQPIDGTWPKEKASRILAGGQVLTHSPLDSSTGETPGTGINSAAPQKKESNRYERLDSSCSSNLKKMAGFAKPTETDLPFAFPNIGHNVWESYRLTGQYHLRVSKLSN